MDVSINHREERLVNIKSTAFVILLSTATFWHFAYATVPTNQTKESRTRLISDMADRICVQAATGGTGRSANLQASVGAELNNLLRRLVKAKANISAGAQEEIHSGVLPGQVLTAAEQANNCKLQVLQVLTHALLDGTSNGGNAQTTYGPNSPIFGSVSGGTITINGK